MLYKNKESILKKSKEAIGKTFGEIDKFNRLSNLNNKGNLGQIIEESFFDYKVNSRAEPDFIDAGVELKVTPYKLNKNGKYSSKERLVLNIIDYNHEVNFTFYNSSFWNKNKTLLLMFYLHDFEKHKRDMKITETILFEYPEDDLAIIKNDYKIINDKIKEGKAHKLSESDTMYLAACTKGSTSDSSYRTQPFNKIKAKSRAFSLKQSYMTSILRKYVFGEKINEKIIKNLSQLDKISFEDFINEQIERYKYKNVEELYCLFNINNTSKNRRASLISKILNVSNIKQTDEFIKAGLVFKTVLINKFGKIKENMSFPNFDFIRLSQENWEDSEIKNMFESSKFVFAVFKEKTNSIEYFEKIVFWSMPEEVIEKDVRMVWEKAKGIINSGNIIKDIRYNKDNEPIYYNNFPSSSENEIIHVRPHAKDRDDTLVLPIKDIKTGLTKFTKQCFWLHRNYILDIVKGD